MTSRLAGMVAVVRWNGFMAVRFLLRRNDAVCQNKQGGAAPGNRALHIPVAPRRYYFSYPNRHSRECGNLPAK